MLAAPVVLLSISLSQTGKVITDQVLAFGIEPAVALGFVIISQQQFNVVFTQRLGVVGIGIERLVIVVVGGKLHAARSGMREYGYNVRIGRMLQYLFTVLLLREDIHIIGIVHIDGPVLQRSDF